MEKVIAMGIDPGLASCGYAFVELGDPWTVLSLGAVKTASQTTKSGVTASADLARRARELHVRLGTMVVNIGAPPIVICVEAMSYPRVPGKGGKGTIIAAKATAQMGYAWGVISAFANEMRECPMTHVSPQDLKRSVCGAANASKADVQERLAELYGVDWGQMAKGAREHAADALGAVHACRGAEVMRLAQRLATEDLNDA